MADPQPNSRPGADNRARYGLRKRNRCQESGPSESVERFLEGAKRCRNIVVFSGSGLSATAGVSMFGTKGGLYDRFKRKFGVQDGKKLFTYAYYSKNAPTAQAFFADIFKEVIRAEPGPSHQSLAAIHACGCLRRHYTLNIDGLAELADLPTWSEETNPEGITVEMHGNIRHLVCPSCWTVSHLNKETARQLSMQRPAMCSKCQNDILRSKIMLYDDAQGECIVRSGALWELLAADLQVADIIVWVGISFEQSASVEYFRRVSSLLATMGREGVRQVLINPSDCTAWNLDSATSDMDKIEVMEVIAEADVVLPKLATALRCTLNKKHRDRDVNDPGAG
eukprot:evm.model.scf_2800.2 EVM.evm.TU.scf_2800.2   scf_2800:12862-16964(-)